MRKSFKIRLLTLGLLSTLFMGCGPDVDKIINDLNEKAKIWNDESEKIIIEQYSGAIQSDTHRVEIYQNSRKNLSTTALDRLNKTGAWENLKGMKCEENDVTYRVKVRDVNNSIAQYYSANIYCNNTKGKRFIPIVQIEKLIEVLEE